MSIVVKLGGHALDSLRPDTAVLVDLAHDVQQLREEGSNVVVVHGGGPQIARLLEHVGIASTFENGLRVTDDTTMDYVAMALGDVNLRIVAALNRAGLAAVGLSGADARLLSSTSLEATLGRVGRTPSVSTEVIEALWGAGLTPVVNSVAVDQDGDLLNCNADTVAGALAGRLEASVLVLLSDVDQLRAVPDDPASALATVTGDEVKAMKRTGAAREGMAPKVTAALDALHGGARRILMANGTRPHALRDALAQSIPTTEVVR